MSFNQHKLRDAIRHPRDISSDTVADMESTVAKYPYFQLLYTLIAKAKHDQQTADAYPALGKAAVYAPDRRVLRQVFYNEIDSSESSSSEESPAVDQVPSADPEVGETTAPETTEIDTSEDTANHVVLPPPEDDASEALREELANTLQVLKDSKEQLPDSSPTTDEATTVQETPTETPVLPTDEDAVDEEPPSKTGNQAEQHEIISKFVEANPSISRDDSPLPDAGTDLAEGSTAMQDDLVTENLAEIMVKQGKVEKATAIYQKLILKYPEKKAYFAQKIEQLTNN